MAGSITGPKAKIRRARFHYETLRQELAGPLGYGFYSYPVFPKMHRDGLEYRFHVGEIPSFDAKGEHISLILGDFLFDLRSALDQAVYELHVRHFRGKVPCDIEERTQFPIYTSGREPRYRTGTKKGLVKPTSEWGAIKCLSDRNRKMIETLQPYKRRNDKNFWICEGLEVLVDLNNIDKHRRLHVAEIATAAVVPQHFPSATGFHRDVFWGDPLESHAEVYRWTFTNPPDDIASHVNMNHEVTVGVRVEERGQPVEVLALAQFLLNQIEGKVIPRFAAALH